MNVKLVGTIKDVFGNLVDPISSIQISRRDPSDLSSPQIRLLSSSTGTNAINTDTAELSVTFDVPVTGLSKNNFFISGIGLGSFELLSPQGSLGAEKFFASYNLIVQGLTHDGSVAVILSGGSAKDEYGNICAEDTTFQFVRDTVPPWAPVLTSETGLYTSLREISIKLEFEEPVKMSLAEIELSTSEFLLVGSRELTTFDTGDDEYHRSFILDLRDVGGEGALQVHRNDLVHMHTQIYHISLHSWPHFHSL